jgi:CHAD domain-containing protein
MIMNHASLRAHARQQAGILLLGFREQAARAARQPDADAVHDVRVSIRRLTQCLRVFGEFFPKGRTRRTRRELKKLLGLAAEVRNRDIAIEFLSGAGLAPGPALALGRTTAERRLCRALLKHGV